MILVEVANTLMVDMGKEFLILLKGSEDERVLPIKIGQLEAQSIAIHLNQIPFPRPLTHDLFKSVLIELECRILRTVICDLVDDTFYAKLVIDMKGREIEVDSRPSDAIALALRFSASIYVEEKVMDEAGIIIPEDAQIEETATTETKELDDINVADLTPMEVLKSKLQRAIEEERYEDAAHLKDEIDKMAKSN
jgi:uncharacterized protein